MAPANASVPISPEPGVTTPPSSRNTRVPGTGRKREGKSSTEEVTANANGPPSPPPPPQLLHERAGDRVPGDHELRHPGARDQPPDRGRVQRAALGEHD